MAKRGPCAEWPNCECPRCMKNGVRVPAPWRVTGQCYYCDRVATTWDHVIPRSKGGADVANNKVPACKPCNERKGSMDYREFMNLIGKPV